MYERDAQKFRLRLNVENHLTIPVIDAEEIKYNYGK